MSSLRTPGLSCSWWNRNKRENNNSICHQKYHQHDFNRFCSVCCFSYFYWQWTASFLWYCWVGLVHPTHFSRFWRRLYLFLYSFSVGAMLYWSSNRPWRNRASLFHWPCTSTQNLNWAKRLQWSSYGSNKIWPRWSVSFPLTLRENHFLLILKAHSTPKEWLCRGRKYHSVIFKKPRRTCC